MNVRALNFYKSHLRLGHLGPHLQPPYETYQAPSDPDMPNLEESKYSRNNAIMIHYKWQGAPSRATIDHRNFEPRIPGR